MSELGPDFSPDRILVRASSRADDSLTFDSQTLASVVEARALTRLYDQQRAVDAIASVTGRKPKLSTSGGTSDARFIKNYCPVLEFGLTGQTMHQVDERVATADLECLTAVYRKLLDDYAV